MSSSQGGERNALCVLPAGAAVVASFRINFASFAFLARSSGAAEGSFLQVVREERFVKNVVPLLVFKCFNILKAKKFPPLPTFPSVSFVLFHD